MTTIYSLLPLQSDDWTRLPSIGKRSSDGTLKMSMEVRKFSDRPHYHALSFTWRNPLGLKTPPDENAQCKVIICNGFALRVLPNLFAALVMLNSSKYRNDLFWIDALCINQDDTEEKAAQLRRMPMLYRCADSVIQFLGPKDDDDDEAISLIDRLGLMTEANRKSIHPYTFHNAHVLHTLGSDGTEGKSWICLARFFCRSYFSRAWVVQEILHASSLIAFCGSEQVDWMDVVKTSEMLSTSDWNEVFHRETFYGLDRIKSNHLSPATLRASRFERYNDSEDTLLYSLIRARDFACSDARDKVFSIISTSKVTQPIDYTLSKEDVYKQNAIMILEARQDLLLLVHVEGKDNTSFTKIVPSWVPDWSTSAILGLGVTGYKRFDAARNKQRHIKIDGDILEVKGELVDAILMIGEIKADVPKHQACLGWLRLVNAYHVQVITSLMLSGGFS